MGSSYGSRFSSPLKIELYFDVIIARYNSATKINKKVNVNNINTVSEVNMDYTMDIFFRQYWIDKRLSFEGNTHSSIYS